jgi:hypothetical protein
VKGTRELFLYSAILLPGGMLMLSKPKKMDGGRDREAQVHGRKPSGTSDRSGTGAAYIFN